MIAAWLLAAAVATSSGAPALDPEAQAKVAAAQAQIDALQKEIADAQEKEEKLLQAIDELDASLSSAEADLATLKQQVADAQAKADDDKKRMATLNARIGSRKHWLAGRLRSIYMHGRPGYLKILFGAENVEDLLRRTKYQRIVAAKDAQMVADLKRDLDEVQSRRADYDEELKELQSEETEAAGTEQGLAMQRSFRGKLLAQVQQEKSGYQKVYQALLKSQQALTTKVGALTGVWVPSGKKFDEMRGALAAPVTGKIRLPFGPYVHPKLGLNFISQGIYYDVPVGTEVHAVFDGKVEMAQMFSSYGQVLVIDHGDGWRSLYAHNARLLKHAGDVVHAGETIALSGDTGSIDGPQLFFAIFREGKPVDPAEWLAP